MADGPSLVRTKIDAEIGLHQAAIKELRKLRSSVVSNMAGTEIEEDCHEMIS